MESANLIQYFRHSFRLLRRSPIFSAVVVLMLALGIGANTAVFSVVDGVLLRKLPYRDPDRLVMVWERNPALGASIGERVPAAYTNFAEWVRQSKTLEGIAGMEDANLNRTGIGEPERVNGARISSNFFQVLGVATAMGNSFDSVEQGPHDTQVAILSDAYWQSHFGANHNAIGQSITLNDIPYTIVGVLPAHFYLPSTREGTEQRKPDIWIPYEPAAQRNTLELNRLKMQVYGRLRPGVSLEQARAEMEVIGKRLEEQNPTLNAGFGVNIFPVYVEDVGKDLRRNLLVLLSAVGLILLIACANLANLVLTRAMARQKELAIRKALGASRAELIAQMVMESLVLSSIGGLLGLLVARWGIKAILALKPADILRPEQIHIGIPVLLFTTAASLLAGMLFGIFPALYVSRTEVSTVLKQGAQFTRSHPRTMRAALIVIEVSLASVLLIGAGFMIRSLLFVLDVDPGFRPDHLLTMHFSMPPSRYPTNEQTSAFCRQALERIAALPGVKAASFADGLPLTRIRLMRFTIEGQPVPKHGSEPTADMRGISSPSYFETLGISLVSGRNFTADEINQNLPVIVINQKLAKKLWPSQDAIGKHIWSVPARAEKDPIQLTVIGVVRDTRQAGLETATRPEITRAMPDYTYLTLAVRGASDPTALTASIKQQIWTLDKDLPVFDVQTMQDVLDDNLGQRRFDSFLMSIFGGLAVVLACVGIYGVLATTVVQQTREIGVRMALGASRGDVLKMIMGQGLRWVSIGLVIGLTLGFLLTRMLASLLFGVAPTNLATYIAVSAVMLVVAAVACYLPAVRAIRIDPMRALRYE
ncbi:MAG TPA: ABC transporter permease [Terriglobales bacterium]|nr:ABC transporter permease [Terriglobales bacterium]